MAQEPRARGGPLSGYPPKPTSSAMIAAPAPANPVIDARLALSARTRYNTSGRERPLLWPVLPCPPMAGFGVSTEAPEAGTWGGDLREEKGAPGNRLSIGRYKRSGCHARMLRRSAEAVG